MNEAKIIVNDVLLSDAQVMTVRVALEDFSMWLGPGDSLGEDEIGKYMRYGYQARIAEIRKVLYAGPGK